MIHADGRIAMNKHCKSCPCHREIALRSHKTHTHYVVKDSCTMGKSIPDVKRCFWGWLLPKFRYS